MHIPHHCSEEFADIASGQAGGRQRKTVRGRWSAEDSQRKDVRYSRDCMIDFLSTQVQRLYSTAEQRKVELMAFERDDEMG